MRDPKRISNLLRTLSRLWKKSPDLRFIQLLGAFQEYMHATYRIDDLFYIEDERLEEYLIEFEKHWFKE